MISDHAWRALPAKIMSIEEVRDGAVGTENEIVVYLGYEGHTVVVERSGMVRWGLTDLRDADAIEAIAALVNRANEGT
jgi:hypothetical protein